MFHSINSTKIIWSLGIIWSLIQTRENVKKIRQSLARTAQVDIELNFFGMTQEKRTFYFRTPIKKSLAIHLVTETIYQKILFFPPRQTDLAPKTGAAPSLFSEARRSACRGQNKEKRKIRDGGLEFAGHAKWERTSVIALCHV